MYKGKRIGVVIASYNGEKFIEKQILSILKQTVLPDEIIISDDGSTDKTIEIVNSFLAIECGVLIKLIFNEKVHGFLENFENALFNVNADYVFLSDQDDLWLPNKIEHIIEAFSQYPLATCFFHNGENINSKGEILTRSSFSWIDKNISMHCTENSVIKIDRCKYLNDSTSQCLALGMLMAFQMDFINQILPFSDKCFHHDMYIPFCSLLDDSMYYYNEVLAYHRLHSENTTGTIKQEKTLLDSIKRFRKRIESELLFLGNKTKFYRGMIMQIEKASDKSIQEIGNVYSDLLKRIDVGQQLEDAVKQTRLLGIIQLLKINKETNLFCNNKKNFIIDFLAISVYSKRERLKKIGKYSKELRD